MDFELKTFDGASAGRHKCDALLVLVNTSLKSDVSPLAALIAEVLSSGDLSYKPGSLLDIYRPDGLACNRLILIQMGGGALKDACKGISNAIALTNLAKSKQIALYFEQIPSNHVLRVAVTSLADASYIYTATKTGSEARTIERVTVGTPDHASLSPVFERAVAAVSGIELAKEWGNRPANHATPTHLAQAARMLAKLPHISCKVLGLKGVERLGMGAFMAVAQGSCQALQFIELRYSGAQKKDAPIVLVGKGITFDSGGISIKPAAEMDEMKFDMCGAASVLGVFKALAELQPKINVVGLIPACENLPGGGSIKPGDVVTSMSGQTIEILNTDAEGRLVLCDALTYAERFKPRVVLDIATLTGACVIALGSVRSGLFSSDKVLSTALMKAGESSQDLCWPMPMDDDYADGLKTNFADVANVAGKPGGAVTAAVFLQRFTGKYAWAHLDVAGTAWKSGSAKGATGRPVGLLLDYLMASETGA